MDILQTALGELIPDHDAGRTGIPAGGICYRCGGTLAPGLATCPNCGARNEITQIDSVEAKQLVQTPSSPNRARTTYQRRDDADEIDDYVHRSVFHDILSTIADVVLWVVLFRWARDRDV